MRNTETLHIWRDNAGDYHIEWPDETAPHPKLEIETLDVAHRPTGDGYDRHHEAGKLRLSGLPRNRRHLFRLRHPEEGEGVAGERQLSLEGTPNFRDFGGYRTSEGEQVRWGSLYRSGQLSDLSDHDVALMDDLGIDLICDFRREDEQESSPTRLSGNSRTRILSLPIIPGSNAAYLEEMGEWGDSAQMFDFMVTVNRDLAVAQTPAYRAMFEQLLAVEDARMLVHCSAGKDRTGFAAAIILLALGVPREQVMQDYLLSARYFHPHREIERLKLKYGLEDLSEEAILPMLQVHEAYLLEALDTIDANHHSIEHYLEDELGVGPRELNELRRRYLHPKG